MKKYQSIYEHYKILIENNTYKANDKIPSIRKTSESLNVSKTTVESAYFALQADGYIISKPNKGYFVSGYYGTTKKISETKIDSNSLVKYDFKNNNSDSETFDIKLWHRYIKNALRQEERLYSYGLPQGELDLRLALVNYVRDKRNIVTNSENIVIGAGVQTLLYSLCSLLKSRTSISFPDSSFHTGISLFKDFGYEVNIRNKDSNIIYVCPSHMTNFGDVMSINRRLELIEYSGKNNSIVIEDDYDNDFLYQKRPTPSLYALSNYSNIVYIGSFSNVLLPGIRISFMVLPNTLAEEYNKRIDQFPQTASKTEQIALAGYIRDGHIKSQIKKVRRHYTQKTKRIFELLKTSNKNVEDCIISENGILIKLIILGKITEEDFLKNGILLKAKYLKEINKTELLINPSSINNVNLSTAIKAIEQTLEVIT